jgi:predicted 3-demethylubiquinone-9 3-methyltransferase (glyoxalase superfamily)
MAQNYSPQKITPNLWFDHQAEEAVQFYSEVFEDAAIRHVSRYGKEGFDVHGMPEGTVLTVDFQLAGQNFVALNGGPHFRFNPSESFYVTCETKDETDEVWNRLAEGGNVLMPIGKYDWSERYGWLQDRYGVSWQISLGNLKDVGFKFCPSLLFTGRLFGKAEEAVHFYTSVFSPSGVEGIMKNPADGSVLHAQFYLHGQTFMIMESSLEHKFEFNEAVSYIIHCDNQDEVDYYWDKLSEGGELQQCGWLKDKFGVSWQVVPRVLYELLNDKAKAPRVMDALMKMVKLDIAKLQEA